jgi:hypothetical protein
MLEFRPTVWRRLGLASTIRWIKPERRKPTGGTGVLSLS